MSLRWLRSSRHPTCVFRAGDNDQQLVSHRHKGGDKKYAPSPGPPGTRPPLTSSSILGAIKDSGVEENTIVVFASDNGPEATDPWEGDSGPWRGTYFTAMEASLRAPFVIRWPGKIPTGRVSNEIVHIVDMYPTLARAAEAEIPKDRPIDGVD